MYICFQNLMGMFLFRFQPDIAWKRLVTLALTVCLVLGMSACKQKNKDKTKTQQEQIQQGNGEEAVYVSSFEEVNFSSIDTKHPYIGKIDKDSYILIIESASRNGISGKCYLIDTLSNSAAPIPFKIKKEANSYRLVTKKENEAVTFSIAFDSHSIQGSITTEKEKKKRTISFKRQVDPPRTEYTSNRYKTPQYTFKQISDIQYGTAKGYWTSYPMENDNHYGKMILKLLPKTAAAKPQNLFLDLYIPENDSVDRHPLLLLLHGGAFFFGDKGGLSTKSWCEHFAKMGYVVASANYRLGFKISKASIQQCGYQAMQDAHAALRFLVAHADEYSIDPDYIFIGGTSAGSITALGTTFMTDDNCPPFVEKHKLVKKIGGLHTSGNEHRDKVRIRAVANMWGAVYDLHELDHRHIPILSIHGTEDHVVPFDHGYPFSAIRGNMDERLFDTMYGSLAIHRYLDSLHVRNEIYPLEGCGHAPHQDADGTLNKHYYFIQEKMQQFFYPELKSRSSLDPDKKSPQWYFLNDDAITVLDWQIKGGLILDRRSDGVRVIWFEDAHDHQLQASGHNAIGVPFKQEWKLKIPC